MSQLETLEKEAFAAAGVDAPPEKETDLSKLHGRKPPKKGPCRRCGQNKPINRLMLCYPCWVKTRLEERGWREGMPHPDDCGCEGLSAHTDQRSHGN